MATLKQIMANRRNAQQSSGPKTVAGKTRSSGNALQHGLRSATFLTPLENKGKFEERRKRLIDEWKPQSVTEEIEVNRLARIYWQRDRAERALAEVLNSEICSAIDSAATRDIQSSIERLQKFGTRDLTRKEQKRCRRLQAHYQGTLNLQEEMKTTMRSNTLGVGAAICKLGGQNDKLSILMRYLSHWEREAERCLQNLKKLRSDDDS